MRKQAVATMSGDVVSDEASKMMDTKSFFDAKDKGQSVAELSTNDSIFRMLIPSRKWSIIAESTTLAIVLVCIGGLHGCSTEGMFYLSEIPCDFIPHGFGNMWILFMYFLCFWLLVIPK